MFEQMSAESIQFAEVPAQASHTLETSKSAPVKAPLRERNRLRVIVAVCSIGVLLFSGAVSPAMANGVSPATRTENATHVSVGVDAVMAASAKIPPQPLADPATGLMVKTNGEAIAYGIDPRNGYSRTCSRGYGVETWNAQVIDACAGTVKWYYNTQYRKTLNVLVMQASMPPRTTIDLDAWCSAHPFYCTAAWTFVGMGFTIVWGIIS